MLDTGHRTSGGKLHAETHDMQGLYILNADAYEKIYGPAERADIARHAQMAPPTPWLPETENMIRGAHIASMKEGATFLNTARGAVVHETEMIDVLRQRPDLLAVLDVTYPEPPVPDSPLFTLPNVILTPHIAGSMFRECNRMGRYMVDELQRYAAGRPLAWEITEETARRLA